MDESHDRPPHQVDSTSTRLLARLRQDDPEAWREFVLVYGPVVRYWIRRAGLHGADLADVFQDAFLAVSRNIAGFERQEGHARLRAWLKRVTHSKVLDHFRRKAQ
jgi:RNA polymerase sigma factor (sigma-70 family)